MWPVLRRTPAGGADDRDGRRAIGRDLIPEAYPHPDFREFFAAAKTGYSDRLVAYNRWIFPTVTPWQDYWAGEVDSPDEFPTGQLIDYEAGRGLQFHSLVAMEDDWVFTAEGLEYGESYYAPRYTADELVEYITEVSAVNGVVTINLAIHQDGTLPESSLQIMREVAEMIR